MEQPVEKTFRTKTGFCHITADQIILTRDGIIANAAKDTPGNGKIIRLLVVYSAVALGLLYLAYGNYRTGEVTSSVLLVMLAVYLINGVLRSVKNSATSVIDRKDLVSVHLVKAVPGLTRSC